jgi:hypothetical protein
VKSIVHHSLVWVDPGWQMPAVATDLYKNMLWEIEVLNVIFKDSELEEEGQRPWGDEEPSEEGYRKMATKFIRNIWKDVQKDDCWKDTLVIPPTVRYLEPQELLTMANQLFSSRTLRLV